MKLRIATYNIHKGISALRSMPRIHALKQALTALEADILFLQEVQGRHDKFATKHAALWPEQAQHQFLAGDSHHAVYGMNAVYDHGHHGNALLSRYPVLSATNQDVSDHAFESRGILHCVVDAPKGQVHCYVIHLGLFSRSRRRQIEALIEAVEVSSPNDAPLIIAGDFNDWTNELSDTLRTRLGVTEVFDGHKPAAPGLGTYLRTLGMRNTPRLMPARTFPAAFPCLPLDRIYVRGFEIESAQVLHGALWARLSDHAPIIASLGLQSW